MPLVPTPQYGILLDMVGGENAIARIPTADIIPFHPNCRESSFGSTWHTLADDMSNISRNTLKAVGQTVLQVLSKE